MQKKFASLADCQEALDSLYEQVEAQVDGFEKCKLKDDKFRVGNKYDSGEFISVSCFHFIITYTVISTLLLA